MRRLMRWWVCGVLALGMWSVEAAPKVHTQVRLILSASVVKPGETVQAGVWLKMDPDWHTYWRNPGDSGSATTIQWDLPAGITAGQPEWPVPERYDLPGLSTIVYHDEVLLTVPLQVSSAQAPGKVELKARVGWLECKELCQPGDGVAAATLEVGRETRPSPGAARFGEWVARMPRNAVPEGFRANWEGQGTEPERALVLEWVGGSKEADFFALPATDYEVAGGVERLSSDAGRTRLRVKVRKQGAQWPDAVAGVLVDRRRPDLLAFALTLRPEGAASPGLGMAPEKREVPLALPPSESRTLGLMLLFAFVGGLILNVMPCVLPVIALKVLAFVQQAKEAPAQVRRQGLLYGAGVLVSFAALAALAVAVKLAGQRASWGMQFGNPIFLLVLSALVTLVALNLAGVFEVSVGGRALGAAAGLASRHGAAGAFFNGVLATTLATPCTAPFLGSAVGFAFTQPPFSILAIFLAIGAGLALPYVVISYVPGCARFLPKPGAWMERFKVAMAFPMLATAVWLLNLTADFYGDILWQGLFLVLLAAAAWVYGEFVQRGRSRRVWAGAVALALLAFGYAYPLEAKLRWRQPPAPQAASGEEIIQDGPDGIPWRRWSAAAVARARAEGKVVLVDFTAKWCTTCQLNKEAGLEVASVRQRLKEMGAVALLGDYTKLPADITDELGRFGRSGVPLVLVYPARGDGPPEVLPYFLTPSIVLSALERASKPGAAGGGSG